MRTAGFPTHPDVLGQREERKTLRLFVAKFLEDLGRFNFWRADELELCLSLDHLAQIVVRDEDFVFVTQGIKLGRVRNAEVDASNSNSSDNDSQALYFRGNFHFTFSISTSAYDFRHRCAQWPTTAHTFSEYS